MADTTTIRPFEQADLPGALETLRAALGETPLLRRTAELWRWKHADNPFGPSIVLVAERAGRIAGVRALMRWNLITPAGELVHAVRAVDTATHPDFHRRGVFRTLTESALEVAAADGIQLVFNTPNPRSKAGYLTMGWQEVGSIGVMVRPGRGILRRRSADGLPDPEQVMPGAAPATGIPVSDRPPQGLRTPRSGDYLRWRFAAHPTARYVRVGGHDSTAVIRVNRRHGRDEAVVSDVFGPHARAAISAACRASRAGYAVGWFSSGSPERRAAARAGMVPLPGVTALELVARPLADLPVNAFDLAGWDLAMSDLELL